MAVRGRRVAQRRNFLGVFGHTNIDHIMEVPSFPPPNTSMGVTSRKTFRGGTAANIAYVAAKLGATVALSSFVGEDFPQDYEDALRSAGVDTADLERCKGYSTPTCWIVTDDKEQQVAYIDQGPMRDAGKFELREHAISTSALVHFGTGRPEYYIRAAALASRLGRRIALDPGQEIHYVYTRETFTAMLESADILFANASEMAKMLGFIGGASPKALTDHVAAFVLTKGRKGSELHTCDSCDAVPPMPAQRVADPTGAGDAYRGGFYAAMERGLGIYESCLAGASASSFVVESEGAQTNPPTWQKVLDRLRKNGCAID